MKRIGYIDARRVRYVADGVTKFAIHSWGVVIGGVAGSMSLYLAADYGAYLNSYAAGRVELCAATEVRIRIGGKGFSVNTLGQIVTNYGILSTSRIYFGGTGTLTLPNTITMPSETGSVIFHTGAQKLRFKTDVGWETVTSA